MAKNKINNEKQKLFLIFFLIAKIKKYTFIQNLGLNQNIAHY